MSEADKRSSWARCLYKTFLTSTQSRILLLRHHFTNLRKASSYVPYPTSFTSAYSCTTKTKQFSMRNTLRTSRVLIHTNYKLDLPILIIYKEDTSTAKIQEYNTST